MACTLGHRCVSFISPTRRATIKRLIAYQPHGMLSPPGISRSCPHCLRRFVHARAVAGQKYLSPFCVIATRSAAPCSQRMVLARTVRWSWRINCFGFPLPAEWETYLMVVLFGCQCPRRGITSPRRVFVVLLHPLKSAPSLTSQRESLKYKVQIKFFILFSRTDIFWDMADCDMPMRPAISSCV